MVLGSSSTTRTFGRFGLDVADFSDDLFSPVLRVIGVESVGSVTMNVDPLPTLLVTSMEPPSILQKWRDMVSPSPVPPYFRVVDASA